MGNDIASTKLAIHLHTLTPCEPGKLATCAAINQGGPSKGICVLFFGDYVESEEITIENAHFFYTDENNQPVTVPITFEKRQWAENMWVYYWEDPDFPIPPAVPADLHPRDKMAQELERSFGVRYVPNGSKRKFLDITVAVAPLSNFEGGQCVWRVWGHFTSKREYIQKKNQSAQELREYGVPDHVIAAQLIDESEYDLD